MLRPALHWLGVLLVVASCDPRPASGDSENKLPKRDETLPKPKLLSEIQPARFKPADFRVKPQPGWVETKSKGGKLSQSAKPVVDAELTRSLAQSLSAEELGEGGAVELQSSGLLIHPGETMPTRVEFDIRGKFSRVTLHAWISVLPEEALKVKSSGTAGIAVAIDSRLLGRAEVNKITNQSILLDLSSASVLTIIVDQHDNAAAWDWCMLGLE